MQDAWVGDDGDYLKLGLLRYLLEHGGGLVQPLGVNWYFRPAKEEAVPERALDPELFDALRAIRTPAARTVTGLQEAGLLGSTAFFGEPLTWGGRDHRQTRSEWHRRARSRLVECPTVFLDPDNGMEPDIEGAKSFTKARLPHVLWSELRDWYGEDGKSVIVFQHAGRVREQERLIADRIREALGLARPPLAVRWGQRWLYVIPQEPVWSGFDEMVREFRERWE